MTEYHWPTTYEHAVELFRDTPNGEIEQVVLEAFREFPRHVTEQIEQIGAGVATGNVRSGWAVLRKRLADAGPTEDVTVTDHGDRSKRIRRAKSWMSNAGLHFDRETETLDALFGDNGILRAWANDEPLRNEMTALWHKVRTERQQLPDGERPSGEEYEQLERTYFAGLNERRADVQAALLKAQGGTTRPVGLNTATKGDCDDCEKAGARFHYGKFLLCGPCAGIRQKVMRRLQREHLPGDLELLPVPLTPEEAKA